MMMRYFLYLSMLPMCELVSRIAKDGDYFLLSFRLLVNLLSGFGTMMMVMFSKLLSGFLYLIFSMISSNIIYLFKFVYYYYIV